MRTFFLTREAALVTAQTLPTVFSGSSSGWEASLDAFLADIDPNRALLDHLVICDLLGFDKSVYEAVRRLAAKRCAESSVHGGKQRPRNATLII